MNSEILTIERASPIEAFVRRNVPKALKAFALIRYVRDSQLSKILEFGTDRWQKPDIPVHSYCKTCVAKKEYRKGKDCYAGTIPVFEQMAEEQAGDLESILDEDSILTSETARCPATRIEDREPNYTMAVPLNGKSQEDCNAGWVFELAEKEGRFLLVYDCRKMQQSVKWTGDSSYCYEPKKGLTFKDCLAQVYVIKG